MKHFRLSMFLLAFVSLPAIAAPKLKSGTTAKEAQVLYAEAKVAAEEVTHAADALHASDTQAAPAANDETGDAVIVVPKIESHPAPGSAQAEDHQQDAHPHDEKHSVPHKSHAAPVAPVAPVTATHSDHATKTLTVPAETSLKWLKNGNTRYTKKRFRADGRLTTDRDRTKLSQHPHAIVLACADSRVSPEIVFDQGIGEIFTIRVAGEALDSSVIASIEYAVEHLHPKLLVVMGHTKCGAVDAAIKIKEGDSAGSASLDKLLADIRPRLKSLTTEKPSANLEVESALNADGVARDLVKRSDLIRTKVEQGELEIKSALYWIDTGTVKFY